jgi:alpha-glucosidase
MASDMIENYENNPAFEFITSCPTSWAKTIVPDAKIGDYVIIARKDRLTGNWFVGSITDETARQLNLSFSFLDKGIKYKAKIFRDGKGADYDKNPYPIDIDSLDITSESKLILNLAPGGGTAIMISKL